MLKVMLEPTVLTARSGRGAMRRAMQGGSAGALRRGGRHARRSMRGLASGRRPPPARRRRPRPAWCKSAPTLAWDRAPRAGLSPAPPMLSALFTPKAQFVKSTLAAPRMLTAGGWAAAARGLNDQQASARKDPAATATAGAARSPQGRLRPAPTAGRQAGEQAGAPAPPSLARCPMKSQVSKVADLMAPEICTAAPAPTLAPLRTRRLVAAGHRGGWLGASGAAGQPAGKARSPQGGGTSGFWNREDRQRALVVAGYRAAKGCTIKATSRPGPEAPRGKRLAWRSRATLA